MPETSAALVSGQRRAASPSPPALLSASVGPSVRHPPPHRPWPRPRGAARTGGRDKVAPGLSPAAICSPQPRLVHRWWGRRRGEPGERYFSMGLPGHCGEGRAAGLARALRTQTSAPRPRGSVAPGRGVPAPQVGGERRPSRLSVRPSVRPPARRARTGRTPPHTHPRRTLPRRRPHPCAQEAAGSRTRLGPHPRLQSPPPARQPSAPGLGEQPRSQPRWHRGCAAGHRRGRRGAARGFPALRTHRAPGRDTRRGGRGGAVPAAGTVARRLGHPHSRAYPTHPRRHLCSTKGCRRSGAPRPTYRSSRVPPAPLWPAAADPGAKGGRGAGLRRRGVGRGRQPSQPGPRCSLTTLGASYGPP